MPTRLLTCLIHSGLLSLLVPLQLVSAEPEDLATQLPRIAPHEPQDTLPTFRLQQGFSLELVAHEPDVVDPIDAAFDADGRMYVVEMRDYPFLPDQRPEKYVQRQPERFGSIRLLEDTDGDGRMEKSTVFADRLTWPQSVCCYKGGVFVIAPPSLWYMKDTNGDGVADVKEEWYSGFSLANVQALSNGLEWSFDHGIYWAGGRSGAEIKQGDQLLFALNRKDLRLNPMTHELTAVSGGEQYGHTFDDWGHRFVCNNSNHLQQVVLPAEYLDRNPYVTPTNVVRTIAAEGAAAPVYRISPPEPWRIVRTARRAADPAFASRAPQTELVATGFFTSATGVTVYRGGAYPAEYQGNVFIGDVGGNLVHRKRLDPQGLTMIGTRTEEQVEFLASTDNWFRPTNFVNAPDGTLYILDMYWETIEHPASIPEDIKAHLDLESGNDRGRIYRLVSPNMVRFQPPKLGSMSTVDLVAQLESPHGWVRETAHRLIWERQDASAVAALRSLVKSGKTPQSRLLALWSLQGLAQLTEADVLAGLSDGDAHVREQAVRLSEELASPSQALFESLAAHVNDEAPRVRWQLAFSLGELQSHEVPKLLIELARQSANDADLRLAILTSVPGGGPEFMAELLADPQLATSQLARDTITMLAASRSHESLLPMLVSLLKQPQPQRDQSLLAFQSGLSRQGMNLLKVVESKSLSAADRKLFEEWLSQTQDTLIAENVSTSAKLAAMDLLAGVPTDDVAGTLGQLLHPQTAPELQARAAKILARSAEPIPATLLFAAWKGLGPLSRREAIDGLVQSTAGAQVLMSAIEEQTVRPAELDRDKQQLLLKYPDATVRNAASQLLGAAQSNRKTIVAEYQKALQLEGDVTRGTEVYKKICIQCHRSGSDGYAVGPDLVSVQNKSPDDLLVALMDPNREAQPIYTTYTAITVQGTVATGIIAAENAVSLTLRRAEAKEDVVLREQIDELLSNGVSLMPEGLEKDLSPQQIADVIAYIKSLAKPAK